VFGEGNVITDTPMDMGGEDFAFMLQEKPGCYVYIGNGVGHASGEARLLRLYRKWCREQRWLHGAQSALRFQ